MIDEYADISEQVLIVLRKIIRAIDVHSKKLSQIYGLTGPQLIILKQIAKHNEIATGTLSKMVNLSQPTVTSILDRLEKREYVVRTRDTKDKRKVYVAVTNLGRDVSDRAPSLMQEEFIQKFKKLELWEQNLILSTLQRLGTMMDVSKVIELENGMGSPDIKI